MKKKNVRKKKNTKKTNILKLALIAVLVCALLSMGFYIRTLIEKSKTDPANNDPVHQTYSVTLDDYKTYKFSDVQFDFIMANVTITSNLAFTLPQDPFATSENINLANTSTYSYPLTSAGYKLQCPLPASDTELNKTYCLFIPVVNQSLNDLILKVSLDREYNLSFNMNDTAHEGTRAMLGMSDPTPSYSATIINKLLISTKSFYTVNPDGDHVEASFGSNSQIFGFQVTLQNNTKSALKITNAYLAIDGKGTFQPVDPTYLNDDQATLMGVNVTSMTTGYLFFEITDPQIDLNSLTNSTVHLFIQLSNGSNYVEVSFLGSSQ